MFTVNLFLFNSIYSTMIFFTVLVCVALVSLGEKVAGVTKIFDQCASIFS